MRSSKLQLWAYSKILKTTVLYEGPNSAVVQVDFNRHKADDSLLSTSKVFYTLAMTVAYWTGLDSFELIGQEFVGEHQFPEGSHWLMDSLLDRTANAPEPHRCERLSRVAPKTIACQPESVVSPLTTIRKGRVMSNLCGFCFKQCWCRKVLLVTSAATSMKPCRYGQANGLLVQSKLPTRITAIFYW